MEGLLIGLLWIAVYAVIGVIIIHVILWVLGMLEVPIPAIVPKLLWVVLALILLIMLVQLLLGASVVPRRF